MQAGGFGRDVFLRASLDWDPGGTYRFWELCAPACGLDDAPVAIRSAPPRYLLNSVESLYRRARSFTYCRLTRVCFLFPVKQWGCWPFRHSV